MVYILECIDCGWVKIGYSGNPEHRMKTAAREHRAKGNRREHVMAHHGWFPGGRDMEQACHDSVAIYRAEGEWFAVPAWIRDDLVRRVHDATREVIARMRAPRAP